MRRLTLTLSLLAAACGPVQQSTAAVQDVFCPATHPGVCITMGLPDNPVLFRPCDIILDGVCQYRVFDDVLETDVDKVTTCGLCLSPYFEDYAKACQQYDFSDLSVQP